MLRCIENAIAGGHISREHGRALQDEIDGLLRKGLAPPEVRERLNADLLAEALQRKRRAKLQELRRQELTELVLEHRNARGENDPAEALILLLENHGRARFKDIESTRLAILGMAHAELDGLLHEFRKGWLTGDVRRWREPQVARMENIVKELFGHDSGDATAKELAESWGKVAERLRQRYNAAGGNIGLLKRDGLKWGLTQWHDPEALLNAEFNGKRGKDAWVDYLMQPGVLDLERMRTGSGEAIDPKALPEILGDIWEKITTDGWIKREPSYVPYGKGALGKQRDDWHRFLHFAGPDAWLAYQRAYGEADPFNTMMGHLSMMARDIATMEVLGPDPERVRTYLKQLVLRQAALAKPVGRVLEEKAATITDLLAQVLAPGDAPRAWQQRVEGKIAELADLQRQRRARAKGEWPDTPEGAQAKAQQALINEIRALEGHIREEQRWLKELPASDHGPSLAKIAEWQKQLEPLRARLAEVAPSPLLDLEAKIRAAGAELEDLKKGLATLEGRQAAELRAKLTADLAKVQSEIANIGAKSAPQLRGGLSRRNRGKLERAQGEETKLREQLDTLEQSDTSIAAEHPDIARQITAQIDQVVRDEVQVDTVSGRMSSTAFLSVADPLSAARRAISTHDSMWDLIRGTHFAPISTRLANGMQTTRNVMTAALLGSAAVSALSDVGFQRHARGFAGMPYTTLQIIAETVGNFRTAPTREAVRAGLILDSALHVMHAQARYVEGMNTVTWSGYIADRVIGLSGLAAWTQAGKHAFGMAFQGELADRVGLEFAGLPAQLRRTLDRHGITAEDWDKIRTAKLYEPHEGAIFLRPQEIADVAGFALAEKYLSMIQRETRYAVPEGTIRSRTWLASGRPGTIMGELGRNFGQFKSFGVAVVLLHMGRIADEFRRGDPKGGMAMIAGLAISGAIGGAIVNELLEVINGREPIILSNLRDGRAPTWEYWGAALLRAGGMGVYGDLLFQGLSRPGGLAGILIGPVGGFFDRARGRTLGNVQEGIEGKDMHLGREAVKTVRELMPGGTLWYLRLVKERWFLNQLQLAVDPNAVKSFTQHERLQAKSYGNEYWWSAGRMLPERMPWQPRSRITPADAVTAQRLDTGPHYEIGRKLEQSDALRFQVIDGDTLSAGGRHWRLVGYDAPEVFSQKSKVAERVAGMRAGVRLGELLRSGRAVLEVTDAPDRWGRGRARLTIDGRDVGDIMRSEGHIKRK